MDYSRWELERQRQALAALLLGGGTAEDEEAVRQREGRSPETAESRMAESGTAQERTVLEGGRYAGDVFENRGPGAWETVRAAGRERRYEGPEVPVSAWEAVWGTEAASWRGGGVAETGASAGDRRVVRAGGAAVPGMGLGNAAWKDGISRTAADAKTAPGGRTVPGTDWEAAWYRAFSELPAASGGEAGSGEERKMTPAQAVSGGGETAGTVQRGGGAGSAERREPPVFQVLEAAPGAGAWGGVSRAAAFQAEDGAKALSLAVQRDARRYDGGFLLG